MTMKLIWASGAIAAVALPEISRCNVIPGPQLRGTGGTLVLVW
jgi:hypothetical protein